MAEKMKKMDACCNSGSWTTKAWLQLIAGILIILISAGWLSWNVWTVIGVYLALKGIMKMM